MLPEVVISVVCTDVLVAAVSIWHVTRTTPTSKEHRRRDVEVTPSLQQRQHMISEFTHTGLSTGAERSPRRTMFRERWKRLLGKVVDSEDSDIEQLGERPCGSGHEM